MTREEIEMLLGGYATGTLTEPERRALFEAALSDQGLFDALMNEQPLAEVLADPPCRRRLAAALEPKPSLAARALRWLSAPRAWALAGSTAAVLVLALAVIRVGAPLRPQKTELALVKEKQAPGPVETAPPPAAPKLPLRRFEAPPAGERRAAVEIPSPPELHAAAKAPPPALAQPATAPAPPPEVVVSAGAREMFSARPAAEAADTAPQAAVRAAAPAAQTLLTSALERDRALAGFGLRYSLTRRRLNVEASQGGYLYVLGARGLLFTTTLVAARPYSFNVGAHETKLFLILSRQADSGPPDTLLARARSQAERTPLQRRKADTATYVVDPRGALVLAEVPVK